jgi:hypothetical protein
MAAPLLDLRTRLRPPCCTAAAVAALLAGAALLLVPSALAGSAWPPLHARCVGAMLVSLAVALLSARRALDAAALRMPLLALAAWSLSSAALGGLQAGAPWAWALAAIGGSALLLARIDGDPPAPAQHADPAWRAVALLALLAAALLFVMAPRLAAHWPWRLAAALVAQYAPLFFGWGVAAALLSRERRRYVRAPVLWGLLSWAGGVLAVSLWHAAAFNWSRPLAWCWFAVFAALAVLALHRLWPAWPQRLRRVLGHQSRDSRTRPPRQ